MSSSDRRFLSCTQSIKYGINRLVISSKNQKIARPHAFKTQVTQILPWFICDFFYRSESKLYFASCWDFKFRNGYSTHPIKCLIINIV